MINSKGNSKFREQERRRGGPGYRAETLAHGESTQEERKSRKKKGGVGRNSYGLTLTS